LEAKVMADDGAIRWVADGLTDGPAGHHVLIGRAVAAVFGIPAAEQGKPLNLFCERGADFGELDAGEGRVDRAELAFDADRRVGLGVERIVMARSAAGPNQ